MGIDLAAIRRKVEELQNGRKSSNVQQWKPKEAGEYTIRALPWPDKYLRDGSVFVEKFFYYIGDSFGLLTPHQYGKPDPINDFIRSLYASGSPEDRLIAKKLRAKMQAYVPVIVKKGPGADPEKVLVWSINKFLYQKMLNWFLDDDVGNYLDVNSGFDIKVTFVDAGKKFKGKTVLNSDVELARKQSPLAASDEQIKKLVDSVPNVDDMHQLKTPEELKSILEKWMEGGAGGNDDSEGTERSSGTSKTDALDELVNDVKGTTQAQPSSEPVKEEKKQAKAPKSKKKDEDAASDADEPIIKKQSLDDAFAELMGEDD